MRGVLRLLMLLQIAAFAGCTTKPFAKPEIVGHVKGISELDFQTVIALAERHMREHIGWAVPTERIEVRDRDHFTVIYSYGAYTYQLPITRVRGRWVPPPDLVVTG